MSKPAFEDQETWDPTQGVLKKESVPDALNEAMVDDTSPGRVFRMEREASGVGLREMAMRLNLTLDHIKALEANEFDKLPAPIYVRHYIKRYADMLGISYEPLLDAYAVISANQTPDLSRVSISPQIDKKSLSSHWMTYLLIIGLIIAGLLLWQASGLLKTSQTPAEDIDSDVTSVPLSSDTESSEGQITTVIDLQNSSKAHQD